MVSVELIVLHKSDTNTALAHQFIDFILEEKNSAELTNLIGSDNPNKEALQYIEPYILDNRANFPDNQSLARLEMLHDLNHKQRRLLTRLWIEIKLR